MPYHLSFIVILHTPEVARRVKHTFFVVDAGDFTAYFEHRPLCCFLSDDFGEGSRCHGVDTEE